MEKVKELKENHRISTPTIITRSVGLQVAFDANPVSDDDLFPYFKFLFDSFCTSVSRKTYPLPVSEFLCDSPLSKTNQNLLQPYIHTG